MLTKKMGQALSNQIKNEFYSAYMYLAMAGYFENLSLKGFAKWMHLQAKEEISHGMKFFEYLADRGYPAHLSAIEAPPTTWNSPLAAFEAAFEHEQKVTAMINALVEVSKEEKDFATHSFLQWFIGEQVEEEANALEIVERLKITKDCSCGLLFLDKQLGKRSSKD